MTAGDIALKAAILLNDQAQTTWTNAVLLPHVVDAFEELVEGLESVGASILKEVSAAITVTANATTATLPSDVVAIYRVSERKSGSTDLYDLMAEKSWLPEETKTTLLRYWQYREQTIYFLGATEAREIKLEYLKNLTNLTTTSSVIDILHSTRFLQYRTSAIAAGFRGENEERAKYLGAIADGALDQIKMRAVRDLQGVTVRRKPYKSSRKL